VNPEDIVMAATASSFDAVASRRVATSLSVATAEASSQTVQVALRASVAAAQRLQRQGTYVCACELCVECSWNRWRRPCCLAYRLPLLEAESKSLVSVASLRCASGISANSLESLTWVVFYADLLESLAWAVFHLQRSRHRPRCSGRCAPLCESKPSVSSRLNSQLATRNPI
jgi:hypothetical protein